MSIAPAAARNNGSFRRSPQVVFFKPSRNRGLLLVLRIFVISLEDQEKTTAKLRIVDSVFGAT
jgi:hypothetical protein